MGLGQLHGPGTVAWPWDSCMALGQLGPGQVTVEPCDSWALGQLGHAGQVEAWASWVLRQLGPGTFGP